MKKVATICASILAATLLSACSQPSGGATSQVHRAALKSNISEPEITSILIKKRRGKMFLLNDGKKVKSYDIDLGFSPKGDKKAQGDGKTPEGNYFIDRKNPQSQFYLSLGINYPNKQDREESRRLGVNPGGDIFIHGQGRQGRGQSGTDWTAGCVAVTDQEMNEIYNLVQIGTPVTIKP